tara:strand:- start:379 stop:1083 length:705 start_codon:yes stop_codon:yes gene_type:complete
MPTKTVQDQIRDHFIRKCDFNSYEPDYFISIHYFSRNTKDEIVKHHKWINKVISDVFNPYDLNPVLQAFFIEKGKRQVKKIGKQKVLDTIIDCYELDDEIEVVDGKRHSHLMLSLPYVPLDKPNKNIRKLWSYMFHDIGGKPPSWMFEEEADLMHETIEFALRDRCASFLQGGDQCIDIQRIHKGREFKSTGEKGWKGAVSYLCKHITKTEDWDEVFDQDNSNVLDKDLRHLLQ